MQHPAAPNQSDLIARSMNQNRPVNAMSTRTTPQNLSSAQYNMASRQPSGTRSMVNRSTVASSRTAYAPQPKDVIDPGTSRMRHWVIVFGLIILICLAVAAIVVPLYVKPQYNSVGPPQPVGTTPNPTPSPNGVSVSPSAAAPSKASNQPTTESFGSFVKDFAQDISGSSVFNDPTSPQYKAVEFIANDANYTSTITNEAALGDFYAVTVFYCSTGGNYWFECVYCFQIVLSHGVFGHFDVLTNIICSMLSGVVDARKAPTIARVENLGWLLASRIAIGIGFPAMMLAAS